MIPFVVLFIFFFFLIFIYLATLGLSCGSWDLSLGSFVGVCGLLSSYHAQA